MRALGELVFPLVLADAGGEAATGWAPYGVTVDVSSATPDDCPFVP
jgi:hypothetical protein